MKKRIDLIRSDLSNYGPGILLACCYILFMTFVLRLPVCPMRLFFGITCPGCGITRAMLLLVTGDFAGAWQMHPFIYVLVIWAAVAGALRYGFMKDISWMRYVAVVVAVAAIVFWFLR